MIDRGFRRRGDEKKRARLRLEKKPEAPHVVRKATFSLTLPRRPTTLSTPSKQEKTALFLFLFLHPFSRSLSPGGKNFFAPQKNGFLQDPPRRRRGPPPWGEARVPQRQVRGGAPRRRQLRRLRRQEGRLGEVRRN